MSNLKLILRESVKMIVSLAMSIILAFLAFMSFLGLNFNIWMILLLVLVCSFNTVCIYLTFSFMYLLDKYDLHNIEKIEK